MAGIVLPPADWRNREGLAALIGALDDGSGGARYVGGAVRDTLLGVPVHDVDIATRLAPQVVLDRLAAAGIRPVPTGFAHGTITAVLHSGPVEVTTLRRDVATDGRHAIVAFTEDWQEDASRRDFTINALYADPASGAVFDYFGGLDDLAARRVRFIGDPLRRIAEDHLRILRFFRFLARFGDAPDPAGLRACTVRANDLMTLSRERVADEVLKLLVAGHAQAVVRQMLKAGIFAPVLPEISVAGADRLERVAGREAAASVAPDPIRRLAALLPDDPDIGDAVGARLKLSNAARKRLVLALDAAPAGPPRALAYRLGREGAIDRLFLHQDDEAARAGHAAILDWVPPRLPISGGSLVARGIVKGPVVARTLRAIEDQWMAEDFPGEARLAEITDDAVAQSLRSSSNA